MGLLQKLQSFGLAVLLYSWCCGHTVPATVPLLAAFMSCAVMFVVVIRCLFCDIRCDYVPIKVYQQEFFVSVVGGEELDPPSVSTIIHPSKSQKTRKTDKPPKSFLYKIAPLAPLAPLRHLRQYS